MPRSVKESLASLNKVEEVQAELNKIARSFGYDRFLAAYLNPEIPGSEQWLYNYTLIDLGFNDADQRDPVLLQVRNNVSPIIWGPEFYKAHNAFDLWAAGHDVGFYRGIACPTRLQGQRRFTLYVDCDKPFDGNPEHLAAQASELAEITEALAVSMVALGDKAKSVTLREFFDQRATLLSALSKHELEVLRWVFEKQTLTAIAKKIKKHESYVSICIDEAMRKLNAPSPLYAAIFAAQLGLFDAHRR